MLGAGLDGKHGKIRSGPQTSLRFHRLPVRPEERHSLDAKIQKLLSKPTYLVRQLMSLNRTVYSYMKQVHPGRLPIRPIHWHLKNNWRLPESLEKQSSLTLHLK